MQGMIDFHTHILPDVDDGSKSVEESIALLRAEAEQGIGCVVATPHFYPQYDTPEQFLERRNRAEAVLREEMVKYSGLPEVVVGAEVYYFNGIGNSDAVNLLTIDKKACILIEMPVYDWQDSMYRDLEELRTKQGLTPIVAHVDRYFGRFRTYGIPKKLSQLPVLVQANANFFLDKTSVRMALRMLKKGQIHLLGSDCHNTSNRLPNMGQAVALIEKRLGEEPLKAIRSYQTSVLQDG